MSTPELAKYIDHTLLRPDATEAEILRLCQEAKELRFKTVCLEAKWLSTAVKALQGTDVWPITVVGFPGGDTPTAAKIDETRAAVRDGAREIDMVLNRVWLKEKRFTLVFADITGVVAAANGRPVKVILETSELTDPEKIQACTLAMAAGAAYVKTSTGFSKSGATEADVRLMRQTVGPAAGVKASGGVRTRADAEKMIAAGADRLGTSASVSIVGGTSATPGGSY